VRLGAHRDDDLVLVEPPERVEVAEPEREVVRGEQHTVPATGQHPGAQRIAQTGLAVQDRQRHPLLPVGVDALQHLGGVVARAVLDDDQLVGLAERLGELLERAADHGRAVAGGHHHGHAGRDRERHRGRAQLQQRALLHPHQRRQGGQDPRQPGHCHGGQEAEHGDQLGVVVQHRHHENHGQQPEAEPR
jgi:hypothetical protein